MRLALALAAIVLVAAGCMAERDVLTPLGDLTATKLREDGLAVGGVVIEEEVEQARVPLVDALERSLHYWRPDLAVLSAGRVRDQLGLPAYRRILMGYQNTGKFTDADRAEIATALRNGARYLIFARVDQDAVNKLGLGQIKASTVTGMSGRMSVEIRSRTAKVRILLYDVLEGREVQNTVYASSSDNAGPDKVWRPQRPPDGPVRIPDGEYNIEIGGKTPVYDTGSDDPPDSGTPTLVDAVVEGFRAFVADLPPPEGAGADSVPMFRYQQQLGR